MQGEPFSPRRDSYERKEGSPEKEIIIEGEMLKKAFWREYYHERYFVLKSDNTLAYYSKKGGKKKASYNINECDVSDLYISKHNKELIYCIRLTFPNGNAATAGGATVDSSLGAADDNSSSDYDTDHNTDKNNNTSHHNNNYINGDDIPAPGAPLPYSPMQPGGASSSRTLKAFSALPPPPLTPDVRRSPFRRKLSVTRRRRGGGADAGADPNASLRSIDNESITVRSAPGWRKTLSGNKDPYAPNSTNTLTAKADIPALVEVESRALTQQTSLSSQQLSQQQQQQQQASQTSKKQLLAAPTPHRSTYETQCDQEQEYLRAQYLESRKQRYKKSKRKIVQGTKIAAAAGATVGLAVVTAGVGLAAGLVFLGAAAAGGGSAAMTSLGTAVIQNEAELVLAAVQYEVAKEWKNVLDAARQSAALEQSTWGQLFAGTRKARLALLPPTVKVERVNSPNHHHHALLHHSQSYEYAGSPTAHEVLLVPTATHWRPLIGGWAAFLGTGLRILREERVSSPPGLATSGHGWAVQASNVTDMSSSVDGKPCAPVKANVVLNASALDAFLCLMSFGCVSTMFQSTNNNNNNNSRKSMNAFAEDEDDWMKDPEQASAFRIIESIDDNTDVLHFVMRPLYLFPSWTAPRDFVLFRYWRLEQDGSYIVCFESVQHKDCPPHPDFVRGEMHKVFTIAPLKKFHRGRTAMPAPTPNECLMTAVVQVDPRGWVPTQPLSILSNQSYGDAYGIATLLQLLEIRDAIDNDRFIPVCLDQSETTTNFKNMPRPRGITRMRYNDSPTEEMAPGDTPLPGGLTDDYVNYDFSYASREFNAPKTMTGLTSTPPPLDVDKWAEPDANSFRVRGKYYLEDSQKYNAGPSIGRLVAVDVVSVDKPIYSGFTLHPTERMQMALRKEAALIEKGMKSDLPPFVFVVNIVIPGPPFYHMVNYFAVDDRSKIDGTDGTPSSKLCNAFFFGDSDEFRDQTFKLIPQIVQGNFIVRKAVGSTPAVMGKKLRQLYVRHERFMEVILDCGSSPVATGVIRLCLGYARSLVVDMGFLLEGNDASTLPERVFGCVRLKHLDFGQVHMRHVTCPPGYNNDDDDDYNNYNNNKYDYREDRYDRE